MGITDVVDRLFPDPDGESPMLHRSAVVTAVNSDGTLTVDLSGVSVTVNALAGSGASVGDTVHLAAWAGDLISLGAAREATVGGPGSYQAIPASVAVTGGGASYSIVNGRVIVAAATSVTVNDLFPVGVGNVRIRCDLTMSTAAGLATVLRAGGVNQVTGYDRTRMRVAGTTLSGAQDNNVAAWETVATALAGRHVITIDLFGPGVAAATAGVLVTGSIDNAMTAGAGVNTAAIQHRPAVACDGIALTPGGGTISGTISATLE